MYRQKSLITLDQFYEMKPLTKLEAILSFVDFSLLENTFPIDIHRRGPRGYSKKQLLSVLLAMQTEQIFHIKALVQKLKTEPMFKRNCGFDYLDHTPSEATLNRFITQLSSTDILERTYRRMIHKAKSLGLIDGENVAIDASKITSYEHAVRKKNIPENDPEFPNWGGKLDTNGNFIKWFGWKMHALVDTLSGIPLSYKELYNQRTSVERTFGDLKDNYTLDNLRVSKMKRAKVFMDLSCISLLASRLADADKNQQKTEISNIA